MLVHLAKNAGFCAGAKLAIKKAMDASKKYPKQVYMLGDILHNQIVIKKLAKAGIKVVENLSDIPSGSVLLIRAHGSPASVFSDAIDMGLTIVDATCPMVQDIHDEAVFFSIEGYKVVIIGDKGHDEVTGIAGDVENPIVVSNTEDAKKIKGRFKKVGVVVQSTQEKEKVLEIVRILRKTFRKLVFKNTICTPTLTHQKEVKELPKTNDVMIIIGSKKSANTKRLFEIAVRLNPKTFWIESEKEIDPKWFLGIKSVGVTAGASTPDEVIKKVVKFLKKI